MATNILSPGLVSCDNPPFYSLGHLDPSGPLRQQVLAL